MSNVIKCPVCHEMAGLRYNENRVYQSRCQNMKCRETVTVTAPSGKAAEELFSKFGKGTIQPKLSIPKKIAEELDKKGYIVTGGVHPRTWELEVQGTSEALRRMEIARLYLASKALGVELVEVTDE